MDPAPLLPVTGDALRAALDAAPDGTWHTRGRYVDHVVQQDDGVLVVRPVGDRGLLPTRLVTPDPRVLETFLVLAAAGEWRREHGLPPLGDAALGEHRAHAVVPRPPHEAAVRRLSDATLVAWQLSPDDARRLAAALEHDVETVVAAVTSPLGRPVWTGALGTARPARSGARLALLLAALGILCALLAALVTYQLRRHAGSWELVVGTRVALALVAVAALGHLVRSWRQRRRRADVVRSRPGSLGDGAG